MFLVVFTCCKDKVLWKFYQGGMLTLPSLNVFVATARVKFRESFARLVLPRLRARRKAAQHSCRTSLKESQRQMKKARGGPGLPEVA